MFFAVVDCIFSFFHFFILSKGTNMKSKTQKSKQFGQGMTEYIIIVALIAVAAIAVFGAFGKTIRGQMASITGAVAGNTGVATSGNTAAQAGATASQTQGNATKTLNSYNK
jgi:type IV pilus assembly protein PilA